MPFWSKWKPLKFIGRALTPPAEARRLLLAEAQQRIEDAILEALQTRVAEASRAKARAGADPIIVWLGEQVE